MQQINQQNAKFYWVSLPPTSAPNIPNIFFNTVYKTDTYHYLKNCVKPFQDKRFIWQVQRYNAAAKKVIEELFKYDVVDSVEEFKQVTRD